MSWKCPQCGFQDHKLGATHCELCGELPNALVLHARTTGDQLVVRVSTDLGRRILAKVVGDDQRFLSEVQFHLRKDSARGAWVVESAAEATNRTYYNGKLLEGSQLVGLGAELTVGPRGQACLQVRFAP